MNDYAKSASLPQRLKNFYQRVTDEGSAALVELPELYSADVQFTNPVVSQQGLENFRQLWVKAFGMYKVFEFHNLEVTGTDEYFAMTYTMAIGFGIGPIFKAPMATSAYGRDGKIYVTHDYFDSLGVVLAPFPILTWFYHKIFGVLIA